MADQLSWHEVLQEALADQNWYVAEGALRRLLMSQPDGTPARADQLDLLAYCLLMQGRFEACEDTLAKAFAAGSRSFWTPHKLGDARRGLHRPEAAAEAYEQALAWGSDSPLTVRNLLEVLLQLDPAGALQRLQQLAHKQQPGWQAGACAAAATGLAPEMSEWLCTVGAADETVRALVCLHRLCRLDLNGTLQLLASLRTIWSVPLEQRLRRFAH